MPPAATEFNHGKNLRVLHFDPAQPPGTCEVSEVRATHAIDELTVQVWLLYYHPNFIILQFVYKRDGITDGQKDGWTNGQTGWTIQTLDAPGGQFRQGA